MESLVLFLPFLAIIVQLNGVISENNCIGKEINEIHRFKRSHEYDKAMNSTNNKEHGKKENEKSKIDISNKKREQISPKRKLKVGKYEQKERDSQIVSIKQTGKLVNPTNLKHFIEDVDEELPVPVQHIQINKHRLKEPVQVVFENKTLKGTKPLQKDKIEKVPKTLLLENVTKESTHELIPQLRTADRENDKKSPVMASSDLNRQSTAKSVNTMKEPKDFIASVSKSSINEFDSMKQVPEGSIIEIKEHKYEEEIVRYYPTKSCQPNIKRHWEASQNFNPQFSHSPYIQTMNPNHGLTQTDPYQTVTYNKDEYLPAYTCINLKDQSNGNYFYVNFDVQPYNQAKEGRRYQAYVNYDRIKKTWLDRDTKIKTTSKPNEYVETNVKGYVTSNK